MYKEINLGNWIYLQKVKYREGKMASECVSLLNELHMVWENRVDFEWEEKYAIAVKFFESNGSLSVPVNQIYEGVYLGKWISHQRQAYQKGKLSYDKIERLEKLNMIWDASKNNIASSFPEQALFFYIQKIFPDAENRYQGFKSELDIYIPSLNVGIEYDGFAWHQNLEKDVRKNNVLANKGVKIVRIREKGCPFLEESNNCKIFDIERGYTDLKDVLQEVIEYLNGTCEIDIDLIRDQMEITSNYINIYNTRWDTMYEKVCDYYDEHGQLPVGDRTEIGRWLSNQRQRFKHKKVALNSEQINKLNAIGIVWEPYKDVWDSMYCCANAYYEEYGDLCVPVSANYQEMSLGSWISTQRSNYIAGKLSQEKIALLDKIGMVWSAKPDYEQMWNDMYALAEDYYKTHGNLKMVLRLDGLGRWINRQRDLRKKGELSEEKIHKLDSIGMTWEVFTEEWDEMYALACEYYHEYGNLNIKAYEQYKGKNLGGWVCRQSSPQRKLTEEQTVKLEKLNIVWNRKEAKWDKMFVIASHFFAEHGHLLVNTHSQYEGENLGQWINKQRSDYAIRDTEQRNCEFTEERIRRLEDIGMIWDAHSYKWDRMYAVALKYYQENGNLILPAKYIYENVNLGSWIYNQRMLYRGIKQGKKLDSVQIQKLENIGMQW